MTRPEAEKSPQHKPTRLTNWMGNISYDASAVVPVHNAAEIQSIVRNTQKYPPPVRAKGSHHSTTACLVADGGTVVDMTPMNRILSVDKESLTVTVEAGVLQVDLAQHLLGHGLQQFINVEIGTMTMGSAATCGTKEASFRMDEDKDSRTAWEFGQVSSYCTAMKVVLADGTIKSLSDEDTPELMRFFRDSYGLLGIAYELTFRVKPVTSVRFRHVAYTLDEFAFEFDKLLASRESVMFFIYPFLNRIVVEYRLQEAGTPKRSSFAWQIRNFAWRVLRPSLANVIHYVPFSFLRNAITNALGWVTILTQTKVVRDYTSKPPDQILRFRERAGLQNFTFTFWAFPVSKYVQALRDYFEFVRQYDSDNGYRCDLVSLGYLVGKDSSGVFSYCKDEDVMTIDPGASGRTGWPGFLQAYNSFCIERDGRPMFNQTGYLTPLQAKRAYESEIREFLDKREELDPDNRFYNQYFKRLFSEVAEE